MSVLKKRAVQLAIWLVIVAFLVTLVIAIFRDQSELPGITMAAGFVFVLFRVAISADRRKSLGVSLKLPAFP